MTPRISIFGVVRRLREQRYCMVQSVSQYEFIYEYILDYVITLKLISPKFPRNTFGLEEDEYMPSEERKTENCENNTERALNDAKIEDN